MSIPTMSADVFAGQVNNGFTARNLLSRLRALGLATVCSRCGGSGHYSFNRTRGTICFKCDGRGVLMPPLTMARAAKVRAAVAAGKLEPYLAAVRANLAARGIRTSHLFGNEG